MAIDLGLTGMKDWFPAPPRTARAAAGRERPGLAALLLRVWLRHTLRRALAAAGRTSAATYRDRGLDKAEVVGGLAALAVVAETTRNMHH